MSRTPLLRSTVVALAGALAAVALPAIAPHAEGLHPGHAEVRVVDGECQNTHPPSFEARGEVHTLRCPACVLQLDRPGYAIGPGAAGEPAAPDALPLGREAHRAGRTAASRPPARAPPAS
ncbi:MAG TPA: hypothetical protein VMT16_01130 [Thermoanaerobaculia bacterium]|nr:hypothetical protein [Thermoanaerobaculia bacterium]